MWGGNQLTSLLLWALKVERLKLACGAEPRLPSCPEWGPRAVSLEDSAGILLSASRWRQGPQWPPDCDCEKELNIVTPRCPEHVIFKPPIPPQGKPQRIFFWEEQLD